MQNSEAVVKMAEDTSVKHISGKKVKFYKNLQLLLTQKSYSTKIEFKGTFGCKKSTKTQNKSKQDNKVYMFECSPNGNTSPEGTLSNQSPELGS